MIEAFPGYLHLYSGTIVLLSMYLCSLKLLSANHIFFFFFFFFFFASVQTNVIHAYY